MKIVIDIPAKQFNLIMHGEFYRATDQDYTILMESFNCCTILPKGHGRLIDADTLEMDKRVCGDRHLSGSSLFVANKVIEQAPTIIGADMREGEKE